jgi:hypothetical protein
MGAGKVVWPLLVMVECVMVFSLPVNFSLTFQEGEDSIVAHGTYWKARILGA